MTPSRPQPAHPPGTRERLVEAARELFSKNGYAATGTRAIAARADCNLSLIKHYFGSKDGLLKAIIAEQIGTAQEELRRLIDAEGPIEERLATLIDFLVDHFDRHADGMRVFFKEVMQSDSPIVDEIRPIAAMNQLLFMQLLEKARAQGKLRDVDPRYASLMMMGMLQFYFIAYPVASRLIGPRSPKVIAQIKRHIRQVFLHGVLK